MKTLGRAVASDLVKLRRPGMVWAGLGTMVGLTLLLATLMSYVSTGDADEEPAPRGQPELQFASERGPVLALELLAGLLGTVTLVLFAQGMGVEYGSGTLKVLLTREPRRLVLLSGKVIAMSAFTLVGILLAALAQAVAVWIVCTANGLDLGAWWSPGALGHVAAAIPRVWLACVAWGTIGLVLATLLRSAPAAIGIGLGYTLVVENLLGVVAALTGATWPRWLPGNVLSAFAQGGGSEMTQGPLALGFWPAAAMVAVYAALALAIAGSLLHRRDVAT